MKSRWTRNNKGKAAPQIIFLIVGLAAGLAVGGIMFSGSADSAEPTLPENDGITEIDTPAVDTSALEAERDGLKARVTELDQAISDRDRIIDTLRADIREVTEKASAEVAAKEEKDDRKPGDRRQWDGKDRARTLAELKEKNPEEYAKIQERINGFTGRMTETMTNQGDFLATLDEALMTEEQRENHLKLQETLLGIQTTMGKMQNGELDNADTWAMRREMMSTMKDLGPMLNMERQAALGQLGYDLGYEQEEERGEFVEYLDHVYDMTSPGTIWKSMMGGRGGPGGKGGPSRGGRGGGEK